MSEPVATAAPCRFCGAPLTTTFVDLGLTPLCQNVVRPEDAHLPETFYPLKAFLCDECRLVQLDAYLPPEDIFTEYAYFSSYSDSWLDHARQYVAEMVDRFGLDADTHVVEVASNDGYLLQYFVERGIPCLGIEPAANVARAAEARGVRTRVAFFDRSLAREMKEEGLGADLLAGANVLAQIPELNPFVAGWKELLNPGGVMTIEFPHLMKLMEHNQFDTIYHEHFSYFSFLTASRIFERHGIELFDVEELPTHGGSLRIYGRHAGESGHSTTDRAREMRDRERSAGLDGREAYMAFADQVAATKRKLLRFLIDARDSGKRVAGYGAPGKGNTLLNYCGIGPDLVSFTVDRNPYKQHTLLPGSRIPVYPPDRLRSEQPDYILILPWNLKHEIMEQMADARSWGARFVVPIPEVQVLD